MKINRSYLHAFWCEIITSWQQMFFDKKTFCSNIKYLKSITIFWCYALWIRCWFKYYVKKFKKLKINFKRFKRFDQNRFDFESINNETFFRRSFSHIKKRIARFKISNTQKCENWNNLKNWLRDCEKYIVFDFVNFQTKKMKTSWSTSFLMTTKKINDVIMLMFSLKNKHESNIKIICWRCLTIRWFVSWTRLLSLKMSNNCFDKTLLRSINI
jgi:hypothetical protein